MSPSTLLGIHSDTNGDTPTIIQSNPPALPDICAKVDGRVEAFLNTEPRNERTRHVQEQTRASLKIIQEALERYSSDELSISYNGGKDCLVLLILYLAALHRYTTSPCPPKQTNGSPQAPARTPEPLPQTLRSVYILSPHPFPEVDAFVATSAKTYHLSLARYAKPMREAFTDYLANEPAIRAIFVGTRRTDPHGSALKHFDPTDRGWPAFMRIHPVIDWHYAEIWAFIRELDVPYCELYDMGYTSLGGTTDTHPNPALRADPGGGMEGKQEKRVFRPAYELEEDDEERLGRDR
ncbi:hypothetical protein B0A48_04816 [Cryoendolithus antarcticus]|uniref:FAD synthase n=1 Tax=Cryoendolithus antarcticus TaxID=1507870 RepID=A0A1V8TDV2_9PEZI|nr:hypothetical protein B0A48_04816 [Cryoendolithus antarcticus]